MLCRLWASGTTFSEPDQGLLDTYTRTFSTKMACLLLDSHRWFTGYAKDLECLQKSKISTVEVLASQLLKTGLELTVDH